MALNRINVIATNEILVLTVNMNERPMLIRTPKKRRAPRPVKIYESRNDNLGTVYYLQN